MKILLTILFVFISASCYSQVSDTITIDDLKKADIFIHENDGFWRIRYDNGDIKCEGEFKKVWRFRYFKKVYLPHGIFKHYSTKGFLLKIEEYKRGKLINVKIIKPASTN